MVQIHWVENWLQHKDSLMDWNSLMDCQGAQSQKEGQEDQEEVKALGGSLQALLSFPGPPRLPSGSSLGSLELPQNSLRTAGFQGLCKAFVRCFDARRFKLDLFAVALDVSAVAMM